MCSCDWPAAAGTIFILGARRREKRKLPDSVVIERQPSAWYILFLQNKQHTHFHLCINVKAFLQFVCAHIKIPMSSALQSGLCLSVCVLALWIQGPMLSAFDSAHDHDFIHNGPGVVYLHFVCIFSTNHIWPSYKSQEWYCHYSGTERTKRDSHFMRLCPIYFPSSKKNHNNNNNNKANLFSVECVYLRTFLPLESMGFLSIVIPMGFCFSLLASSEMFEFLQQTPFHFTFTTITIELMQRESNALTLRQ